MHEYIRKLLFKDLSKTTVEKVLKQMRKLPWDTPEVHVCQWLIYHQDPFRYSLKSVSVMLLIVPHASNLMEYTLTRIHYYFYFTYLFVYVCLFVCVQIYWLELLIATISFVIVKGWAIYSV